MNGIRRVYARRVFEMGGSDTEGAGDKGDTKQKASRRSWSVDSSMESCGDSEDAVTQTVALALRLAMITGFDAQAL